MAMEPISFSPSQNIKAILYDPDQQALFVQFHGAASKAYRYAGVTGEEAYGFGQALSANDHFTRAIRNQHESVPLTLEESRNIFGSPGDDALLPL